MLSRARPSGDDQLDRDAGQKQGEEQRDQALGQALLLAGPAILGVWLGVALQQRIPERVVSLLFALLLAGVAIELIV